MPTHRQTTKTTENNLNLDVNIEATAYINFTSGSSGTPKGVVIPHKGVISLLFPANYVPLSSDTVTTATVFNAHF